MGRVWSMGSRLLQSRPLIRTAGRPGLLRRVDNVRTRYIRQVEIDQEQRVDGAAQQRQGRLP